MYFILVLILTIWIYIYYLLPEQNSTSWAKKIQEEWKVLEKHLPGEYSIPDTK
jgi:hypothetical protein